MMPRERSKHSYDQALVKRYHHLHDVKRIERHRHLPAPIYRVSTLSLLSTFTSLPDSPPWFLITRPRKST